MGCPVRLASKEDVDALLREASPAAGDPKFRALFLRTEWDQVVDAWQLGTWEAYRDVQRLGRRTRLPEARRAVLWRIFEQVREGLKPAAHDRVRRFQVWPTCRRNADAGLRRRGRRRGRHQHRASLAASQWTAQRTLLPTVSDCAAASGRLSACFRPA
jgi:hypothetical protein